MDKDTRSILQRATQAARRTLEEEFAGQLEGVFDIRADGTVAGEAGRHLAEDGEALRVRVKLVAAVQHHRAQGRGAADAVAAVLRECAFTTLNRFVALKMLEARDIVKPCVSQGLLSPGFKEFTGLAEGLATLPDKGYRLYLDSLFDEIGREVKVLFDRRDPASLLWPRKPALDSLLGFLNDRDLAGVWGEDETIGWVYQYFNGKDEREAMRDPKRGGSAAPRNSRELAVRNQFFTPRYVVEFLTEVQMGNTLELARRFRAEFPSAYVSRARQIEQEFHLANTKVKPEDLGHIDTFEFEERLLLTWCASLLEARQYEAAHAVVVERETSFWVVWTDASAQMPRKEQWELCRRVAELGLRIAAVKGTLPAASAGPSAWVARYAAEDGWHRVDAAQRALETWRSRVLDETLVEKAVGVVLREHERLLHDLAVGFTKELAASGWTVPGVLHQTRIHPDVVASRASGTVAWFFVDAMRFEMGAELARHLDGVVELHLQPAIGALPSITTVGMAALLPGASANFAVVQLKGKLVALVDGVPLPGVTERVKYLKARVPDVVDLTLSAALQDKPSDLKKRVAGHSLVSVRSTEIDYLGETGDDHLARQSMDTVIGNIARAVRRLAAAGVERFVITADHGHLFGLRKGDDMKVDPPGGDTVELHRRCWIGRGGATPPGTVRVSAADLGYASDLEFVFPTGLGVFKAGGDLSFHHGSTSLQELVIPVLSFRIPPAAPAPEADRLEVRLKNVPDAITNLVFVVNVEVTGLGMFAPEAVELRVVLLSEKAEQVGEAAMASGAEFVRDRGVLRLKPAATAQVGLMLATEEAVTVRVVVLEPSTGAVLAQSAALPMKLSR